MELIKEKKSILEWFNDLPEPYKSQAIKNSKDQGRRLDQQVSSMHSAIDNGFSWGLTPEYAIKTTYWSNIHKIYNGNH